MVPLHKLRLTDLQSAEKTAMAQRTAAIKAGKQLVIDSGLHGTPSHKLSDFILEFCTPGRPHYIVLQDRLGGRIYTQSQFGEQQSLLRMGKVRVGKEEFNVEELEIGIFEA